MTQFGQDKELIRLSCGVVSINCFMLAECLFQVMIDGKSCFLRSGIATDDNRSPWPGSFCSASVSLLWVAVVTP